MKHLFYILHGIVTGPRAALVGWREYRTDFTTSYDWPAIESYDSGRELHHLVTLRKYDNI